MNRAICVWASCLAFLLNVPGLGAREAAAQTTIPQTVVSGNDEEFARLVKEWTTKPEFLSPVVDHLPKAGGVPSPKDILGNYVGAPNTLHKTADIYKYYRALAASSPRVKVITLGKTDEDRDDLVVFVGSEESIRNLDTYRGYLSKLADPRGLSETEAQTIIAKAKPIYYVTGGLHSTETGPPEMLMELAYRLATEESPLISKIRENMIVAIGPVLDPDGRDRYVDWYRRYMVNDTDEQSSRTIARALPYWGKYVYHDDNRDINLSLIIIQMQAEWYLQWHPPIWHDLHESEPFLYTFSGQAPQNPNLDPILYSEMPWFANFTMTQMAKYGMPGVWTHDFVDIWSPSGDAQISSNHNGLMRMFETFGSGGATTMLRHPGDDGGQHSQDSRIERAWFRPWPAYKQVMWSMRDNTNYMETGVLTEMQLAATFPSVILQDFYEKSRNSVEAGKTHPPFAYVIPAGQRDMTRAAWVVNILRRQGIEVGRSVSEVKLGDRTYPAGSYIVKLNQPYGRLAKTLLEKQVYPDPSLSTYDDSAWTMGLMSGTDVEEISDKAIQDVQVDLVSKVQVAGSISGNTATDTFIAVMHSGSNNLITLRYRLKDLRIRTAEQSFTAGQKDYPPGSLLIAINSESRKRVCDEVMRLGLTATALDSIPEVPTHDLDLPRLAIYSTWGSTEDVGWVRYAFDQFEVPFDLIYKDRVREGKLRDSYDVIIMPAQGRSAKDIVFDIEPTGKPLDYKKSSEFPSLGAYGESEDITGGMGLTGLEELRRFVEDGGVLITLGNASFVPPDFGLVRGIDASSPSSQFYAPGPIVAADIVTPSNPIFYGYTAKQMPVRWANGPLLQVPQGHGTVLMQYAGGDSNVLSGLMRGAREIEKRPAIVDAPLGKGQVLIFSNNPCYRWQNYGEFNLLFNAVMFYKDLNTGAKAPVQAAENTKH